MGNSFEHELLQEETSYFGTELHQIEIEIEALVGVRFPRKTHCLVKQWIIFHADESPELLAQVRHLAAADVHIWPLRYL